MDRRKRGMTQRMFLLQVEERAHCLEFGVEGFSGKNYRVSVNDQGALKCTCPDFYLRKRLCKHLYFIIGRIAKLDSLTVDLATGKADQLSNNQYQMLIKGLQQRLEARRQQQNDKEFRDDVKTGDSSDSCFICFESLEGETMVKCVNTCKNFFHEDCMNIWLRKSSSCPLCRGPWTKQDENGEDELTYLSNVKLKPLVKLRYR